MAVARPNGRRNKRRRKGRHKRSPNAETDFWSYVSQGGQEWAFSCQWKKNIWEVHINLRPELDAYEVTLRKVQQRYPRWPHLNDRIPLVKGYFTSELKKLQVSKLAQRWAFDNLPRTDLEKLALIPLENPKPSPRVKSVLMSYAFYMLLRHRKEEQEEWSAFAGHLANKRGPSVDWMDVDLTLDEAKQLHSFCEVVVQDGLAGWGYPSWHTKTAQHVLSQYDDLELLGMMAKENPRSPQDPRSRLEKVQSLGQAQILYRDLGQRLSLGQSAQSAQGISKVWRRSAKDVRRELESSWGSAVRSTSERSVVEGRGGNRIPVYQRRDHMTVTKPQIRREPYAIAIEYDPQTGEPLVTTDLGDKLSRRRFVSKLQKK